MTDDLRALVADLRGAAGGVRPWVRKALQVTAVNVKDEWRAAANRRGLAGYAADVTFETKDLAGEVVAEIGPTANGDQGSFGFVEDAPGGVASAPQHAGRDAMRNNEADFVEGLEKAVSDALRGLGL